MPTTREFTLTLDDGPGTLGKICRAVADRSVNIVAVQSFPIGGKSTTRLVFDDPTRACSALEHAPVLAVPSARARFCERCNTVTD